MRTGTKVQSTTKKRTGSYTKNSPSKKSSGYVAAKGKSSGGKSPGARLAKKGC